MQVRFAPLGALALTVALFATACSPRADTPATADAGDQPGTGISGAGASFIYPLVSKWSADYNAATGARVNYQSIGSGGGIAQIKAATVDFGSSDAPLSSEELAEAGLGQFPATVKAWKRVNPTAEPGQLRSPARSRPIFMGDIATERSHRRPQPATLRRSEESVVHRRRLGHHVQLLQLPLRQCGWKQRIGEGTAAVAHRRGRYGQ